MAVPINSAIAAYKNAASGVGAKPGMIDSAGDGVDFGSMLKGVVQENIQSLHKGEQMTAKGALGKAFRDLERLSVVLKERKLYELVGEAAIPCTKVTGK